MGYSTAVLVLSKAGLFYSNALDLLKLVPATREEKTEIDRIYRKLMSGK